MYVTFECFYSHKNKYLQSKFIWSTKSRNSLEEHLSSNIFFISLDISALSLLEGELVVELNGVFVKSISLLNVNVWVNSALFE